MQNLYSQQQQQRQQASTYETKAVSSNSTAAASQGRRRTWAESSAAFTGDSFAFGGGTDSMRTRLVAGFLSLCVRDTFWLAGNWSELFF